MPAILFVCTGNQCRSPVAEVLFKRQIEHVASLRDWRIESAGTWAYTGNPAHARMRQAAQEVGLDLSQHRARRIEDVPALAAFDLIPVMERSHKEALQVEFPALRQRIYLLSELAGPPYDISDPIGGALDEFRYTVRELDALIRTGLPRMLEQMPAQSGLVSAR